MRPTSSARVARSAFVFFAVLLLPAVLFLYGCAAVTGSGSPNGPSPAPTPAISVTVSPMAGSVQAGKTATFTAVVANDSGNKGVTWALASGSAACTAATCGALSAASSGSGAAVTYTAPASVTAATTVTLTATSVADTTKSAVATITVTAAPVPIVVAITPTTASVPAGNTLTFTATVTNDKSNDGVTWTLSSGSAACTAATCGTLSSSSTASGAAVTYTAPAGVATTATVSLTATSVADGTKSAAATITVTSVPIAVAITPAAATVQADSGNQSFTATVQNDVTNKGVTWTLSGAGCATNRVFCGTLSASSSGSGAAIIYSAPAAVPVPATVTLTATSVTDTTKSATATIIVSAPVGAVAVTVSPTASNVALNGTTQVTATVQNDPLNKGVAWSLLGASCSEDQCGSIAPVSTASGAPVTFTAPTILPMPADFLLKATSVADPTKSASATITVVANNVAGAITPKRGGVPVGGTLNFSATLTNDTHKEGVTWSASGTGCSGDACGTFANVAAPSTSATYTAPSAPGVYTITATTVANGTQTASATIGVTDLTGLITYHNDLSRDGVNAQEYALTTTNVTSNFGKLASCAVDGAIYTQPLWIPGVTVDGVAHNIVIVGTAHDSLYAFDADASPCVQLWHASMIDSAHGGTPGETSVPTGIGGYVGIGLGDLTPETGVIGTPVIDLSTATLYAVSQSVIQSASPSFFQRLHAIDLSTGNDKQPPTSISSAITVPGSGDGGTTVAFDPRTQNQRAALALMNGLIYVCWGSHEDGPTYRGWVMSFDKTSLNLVSKFNTTPNGSEGGIWMGGSAPAFDTSNHLFVLTGNGAFDGFSNFGDSLLKLSGGLALSDWFTPSDQATLDANDRDLGSGGAAILVDLPSTSPHQHLIVGGGKGADLTGELYVLDRDSLGGYLQGSGSTDAVVQQFSFGNAIFSTGTFWQNNFYIAGVGGPLQSFTLNPSSSTFSTTASSQSPGSFGFPGATAAISAGGTSNGIVWALDNSQYCTPRSKACGPAVLHAYDAANLGTELWNSSQGSGNRAGNAVKFTVPSVVNGKVYVGTRGTDTGSGGTGELEIYGLLQN